jgi:tRNA A37 methylthiotransferase MiaB
MYSVSPGTLAEKLYPDTIPFKEKKRRYQLLDQLINKNQLAQRPNIV